MVKLYTEFQLTYTSIELLDTYTLSKPLYKIHLRVFEVPMSGGLQITKRSDEIESYFKEDKEILFYDTFEELIDKCNYYLRNDKSIKKLKENAYKRYINEHTWTKRFEVIHDKLY